MLPKKLYNFNVFFAGHPMTGLVEEVTLPVLERKMESYRGAGMLGPVSLDLGMNELKLDFSMAENNRAVLDAWGVWGVSGTNLRFIGAAMADDTAAADAVEISVRGRLAKIDPGSVKAGDLAKTKVEMPLTYYRYSVNGETLIEIDLIAGIEMVNGESRVASVIKALGLA